MVKEVDPLKISLVPMFHDYFRVRWLSDDLGRLAPCKVATETRERVRNTCRVAPVQLVERVVVHQRGILIAAPRAAQSVGPSTVSSRAATASE
jgi:hypothetical protein